MYKYIYDNKSEGLHQDKKKSLFLSPNCPYFLQYQYKNGSRNSLVTASCFFVNNQDVIHVILMKSKGLNLKSRLFCSWNQYVKIGHEIKKLYWSWNQEVYISHKIKAFMLRIKLYIILLNKLNRVPLKKLVSFYIYIFHEINIGHENKTFVLLII